MTGKNPIRLNVNFLHADFPILKSNEYLYLVATSTYDEIYVHTKELIKQLHVEPIDWISLDMCKEPRYILMQRYEECSRPDLEDVMSFISNILGSGKSILFLIVSISVNDVFWTVRRL
jgi:hypothetical protein